MRPVRPLRALARPVALLLALALLAAGCARIAEPGRDPWTVGALESLAVETQALFADVAARPAEPRAEGYAALKAQAGAIAGRATLRAAAVAYGADADPATAAYLGDYVRQLELLAERDATGFVAPEFLALRRAATADALSDALIYERGLTDRAL
ncbi:MAG: hypothetical protein ACFCUS_14865 [Rubrimonas sp.]|uniref:hypothetical protein n=1 Tax=Rubrimonas sp. TaxID=2036015 RepID=UPI002FDE1BE4